MQNRSVYRVRTSSARLDRCSTYFHWSFFTAPQQPMDALGSFGTNARVICFTDGTPIRFAGQRQTQHQDYSASGVPVQTGVRERNTASESVRTASSRARRVLAIMLMHARFVTKTCRLFHRRGQKTSTCYGYITIDSGPKQKRFRITSETYRTGEDNVTIQRSERASTTIPIINRFWAGCVGCIWLKLF